MKKIVAFLTVVAILICLFSMVGCNEVVDLDIEESESQELRQDKEQTEAPTEKPTEKPTDKKDNENKEEEKPAISDGKIYLGMTWSRSGDASGYLDSAAVKHGVEAAIKEINEAGGIGGLELALLAEDDKEDVELIPELYEKLLADGMQISLGSVDEACCEVFAENAQKDGVFTLSPSVTDRDIFEYDKFYGMDIAVMDEMDILIDYLRSLNTGKKFPIIYNGDYPYAVERKDYLLAKAPDLFTSSLVIDDEFYWDEMEWDLLDLFLEYDNFVVLDYLDNVSLDMIAGDIEFLSGEAKNFIGVCTDYDFSWGMVLDQGATVLLPFDTIDRNGDYGEFFEKYHDSHYDDNLVALGYDSVYAIYEALLLAIENGTQISAEMTAEEFGEILDEIFSSGFEFDALTGGEADGRGIVTWHSDGRVKKKLVPVVIEYEW